MEFKPFHRQQYGMNHQLQTQQAFVKFHYETNQFPARYLIDRTSDAYEPNQSINFNNKKAYATFHDSLSHVTCLYNLSKCPWWQVLFYWGIWKQCLLMHYFFLPQKLWETKCFKFAVTHGTSLNIQYAAIYAKRKHFLLHYFNYRSYFYNGSFWSWVCYIQLSGTMLQPLI